MPDTSFSVSLPVSVCPTPEFPWREILQTRFSSKASGDPVFSVKRPAQTCYAIAPPVVGVRRACRRSMVLFISSSQPMWDISINDVNASRFSMRMCSSVSSRKTNEILEHICTFLGESADQVQLFEKIRLSRFTSTLKAVKYFTD